MNISKLLTFLCLPLLILLPHFGVAQVSVQRDVNRVYSAYEAMVAEVGPITGYEMLGEDGKAVRSNIVIRDTAYHQRPEFKKIVDNILGAIERLYIEEHQRRDRSGEAAKFLEQVPNSPDKFRDGRSVFSISITGSIAEFIQDINQAEVSVDRVRGILRVARSSTSLPFLPFMENLGYEPGNFKTQKLERIREPERYTDIYVKESNGKPYQLPTQDWFYNEGLFKVGFGTELKSLHLRRIKGEKPVDLLVHLIMGVEMAGLVSDTGFRFDKLSGQVFREMTLQKEGLLIRNQLEDIIRKQNKERVYSPFEDRVETLRFIGKDGLEHHIFDRFAPVMAEYQYVEVIMPKSKYDNYQKSIKARLDNPKAKINWGNGLLQWYVEGVGFEEMVELTRPHPKYSDVYIVPLKISRSKWRGAVMALEKTRKGWELFQGEKMRKVHFSEMVMNLDKKHSTKPRAIMCRDLLR